MIKVNLLPPRIKAARAKRLMMRGSPAYLYKTFENGCDATWYKSLAMQFTTAALRPQFFALDDDLLRPTPAQVEMHQGLLTEFFETVWPTVAEWEGGGRATPPVPTPAPPPPPLPPIPMEDVPPHTGVVQG